MSKFKWLIRNAENIVATIFFPLAGVFALWVYFFKTELTWFGRLFLLPCAVLSALILAYFLLKWFDDLKRWADK